MVDERPSCERIPCYICALLMVQVGAERVVVKEEYHAKHPTVELFKDNKIQLDVLWEAKEVS